MNESEFWNIIEMFDFTWGNLTGDGSKVVRRARNYLSSKTKDEIQQFDNLLAEKLFSLDTRQHAMNLGDNSYVNDEEYFSADMFLYARCSVIANGQDFYNNILDDPTNMVKGLTFEPLLYLASDAFRQKAVIEYDHIPPTDIETYSNIGGWN